MMTSRPAVFLDRDGVINKEGGHVHLINEFHFIDGVFEACREISSAGYRLIIITNQAGIARGYYTEEEFQHLTNWMLQEFKKHGIDIEGVYHCPHHPVYGVGAYHRDCDCRKPAPGMIHRAAKEHSLDLRRSILVGDKATDIEAGRAAGLACCVLVKTGHAVHNEDLERADAVFADLRGVARALIDNQFRTDCKR